MDIFVTGRGDVGLTLWQELGYWVWLHAGYGVVHSPKA